MKRALRTVATTALTCTAVLAASTAAHAGSSASIDDLRADVYTSPRGAAAPLDGPASVASGIDVVQMRAAYSKTALYVTADFANLTTGWAALSAEVDVRYGPDVTFSAQTRTPGQSTVVLADGRDCRPLGMKVKTGQQGSITAIIPRSCLGYAHQVRLMYPGAERRQAKKSWVDSISATAYGQSDPTPWLTVAE